MSTKSYTSPKNENKNSSLSFSSSIRENPFFQDWNEMLLHELNIYLPKDLIPILCSYDICCQIKARPQLLAGSGEKGNLDGPSIKATFSYPTGVCMDDRKNIIVADCYNNCIRQISLEGKVSTIAGGVEGYKDGNGKDASFHLPYRVCMDRKQNIIVADTKNHRIRRISQSGDVETIAGSGEKEYQDGYKIAASFNCPSGVCVDKLNNIIVADIYNNRIRKISPLGQVTTVAGSSKRGYQDGEGILASFNYPEGICIDNDENIIVADSDNNLIRKINMEV